MKIKNWLQNIYIVLIFLLLVLEISGCNKISQGEQRKKFEFLYKMSNYSTLCREYTGSISFFNDIAPYEKRMNKLYDDISSIQVMKEYSASSGLKEKFLGMIKNNLSIVKDFNPSDKSQNNNIRNEHEITKINSSVDEFINELSEEITKVGKE